MAQNLEAHCVQKKGQWVIKNRKEQSDLYIQRPKQRTLIRMGNVA